MKLNLNRVTGGEPLDEGKEAEYYVLGGEHVGASVAQRLHAVGHSVTLVDETHDSDEIPGLRGDPGDVRALEEAGVSAASAVVVATPSDSRNLLTAHLVHARFDVSEIVVLVNTPDRYELFAEVGYEPVCATTALSDGLVDSLEETELERQSGQTV